MKKTLNTVIVVIAVIIGFALLFTMLSRCSDSVNEDKLPEYDDVYYKYSVRTEKNKSRKAYLTGLTELGAEQEALIYPEKLNGILVYGMGYTVKAFPGTNSISGISSDKAKKMFFPRAIKERSDDTYLPNGSIFIWSLEDTECSYGVSCEKYFYGYNFIQEEKWNKGYINKSVANVSYLYNYDLNKDGGYYWVDSYNHSEISFIPPDPTREGYVFGGWYKEKECVNMWNFATDITGGEIEIKEYNDNTEYEGIYLYAKWTEKV